MVPFVLREHQPLENPMKSLVCHQSSRIYSHGKINHLFSNKTLDFRGALFSDPRSNLKWLDFVSWLSLKLCHCLKVRCSILRIPDLDGPWLPVVPLSQLKVRIEPSVEQCLKPLVVPLHQLISIIIIIRWLYVYNCIYIYYAINISWHSTVFRSIPLYSHFSGWTTHFQPVSNISTSYITSRINYMMWVKQTKPSIYSENITLNREKPPSKGKKTCRRPNKQNGSTWMVFFWFTHVHTCSHHQNSNRK